MEPGKTPAQKVLGLWFDTTNRFIERLLEEAVKSQEYPKAILEVGAEADGSHSSAKPWRWRRTKQASSVVGAGTYSLRMKAWNFSDGREEYMKRFP